MGFFSKLKWMISFYKKITVNNEHQNFVAWGWNENKYKINSTLNHLTSNIKRHSTNWRAWFNN
jgi:hypothetical protein